MSLIEESWTMTMDANDNSFQKLPRSVYIVGALSKFAEGLYRPFLQTYMIDIGATYTELGAFRSVGNIAPTILQPAWGAKSDQIGRRQPFVAFGTFSGFLMVFMFLWAQTPIHMIVLYAIQSVLLSIQIPTWQSLIGSLMGEENRRDELGKLGIVTSITSLVATIITGFIATVGYLIMPPVDPIRAEYYTPFYLTAVIGIIASIISFAINEKKPKKIKKREFPPLRRILSKPGDFRKLCGITIFFSFGMSMAWPFFAVIQRRVLEFSLLEIAIVSALMTTISAIFSMPFGRLSDKVGRKPLIMFGRFLLFIVALLYALAVPSTWYFVYIANIIAGISIASSMNAIQAYIYDVAPEEERGSYLAVFNTFTGIVFLLGSLISGIIGDMLEPFVGWHLAAAFMLLASSVIRFVGSFFYLFLDEPREYKSTVKRELASIINRRRFGADSM